MIFTVCWKRLGENFVSYLSLLYIRCRKYSTQALDWELLKLLGKAGPISSSEDSSLVEAADFPSRFARSALDINVIFGGSLSSS